MAYQKILSLVFFLGFILSRVPAGSADEAQQFSDVKDNERGHMYQGTVVSVTAGKLVVRGLSVNGEKAVTHIHSLAANARVTCDGKPCQYRDLKGGQRVQVTTPFKDRTLATRVEALDRHENFEGSGVKDGNDRGKDPR